MNLDFDVSLSSAPQYLQLKQQRMQLKKPNYTLLSQRELEQYEGVQIRPKRPSAATFLKWAIPTLLGIGFVVTILVKTAHREAQFPDVGKQAACPQYPPIKALSDEKAQFQKGVQAEIESDDFLEASVKRMQGAVKIPTESFDDMGPVGEDKRWDIFVDFHEYLEATFPLM